MTVEAVDVKALRRQFPHVDGIVDWRAQQTIRLLWDRIFALEERLTAAQQTIDVLVGAANAQEAQLEQVAWDVREALALAQDPSKTTDIEGSEGEGTALPGGGDGGEGNDGCGDAGANGDITVTGLTAHEAGRVVCGTCNEYSSLLAATTTLEERDANAEELVLRCIWHLQQAGFTAGRQRNPSLALSKDKLCVEVDSGVVDPATYIRAYDIFVGKGDFATAMTSAMNETGPPVLVADAGTPD